MAPYTQSLVNDSSVTALELPFGSARMQIYTFSGPETDRGVPHCQLKRPRQVVATCSRRIVLAKSPHSSRGHQCIAGRCYECGAFERDNKSCRPVGSQHEASARFGCSYLLTLFVVPDPRGGWQPSL